MRNGGYARAIIDWGDGTVRPGIVDQAAEQRHELIFLSTDDGVYIVRVTVTDDDGDSGFDELVVTVGNRPPIVCTGPDRAVYEGDVVELTSSTFTDAGTGDTHAATIDWGDGTVEPGFVDQAVGSVAGSHVYADDGAYTVRVTVTDDDGNSGFDEFVVTVPNRPPIVDVGPDRDMYEGDVVELASSTFTDAGTADTHEAMIDWGDGTVEPGIVDQAAGSVTGSHAYADDGVYIVRVSVTDDDGDSGFDEFVVTVTNRPPIVDAGPNRDVYEGDVVELASSTFTDAGTADTHEATIDWGDGTVEPGIVDQAAGSVAGSHTYADDGVYIVRVTVSDDDGDSGFEEFVVTVSVSELVALSGRVFDDRDNDGLFEPEGGDAGLEGVTVHLFDQSASAETPIATAVTGPEGQYAFGNLRSGTYKLVEIQPEGRLDGKESAGGLGGWFDNDQDSNEIADIVVLSGSNDADGYDFAEIRGSRIEGMVWEDFNNDGEVNFGELAIAGARIQLTGTDDHARAVDIVMETDEQGIFEFADLRPGEYSLAETQPPDYVDGRESLGTVNGVPVGDASVNDQFRGVVLPTPGAEALNYNFGERPPADGIIQRGQTATIGFWQNKHGQALIKSLNGGAQATQLGNWLAATFPNLYGAAAGGNNLAGRTNAEVAAFYQSLFKMKGKGWLSGPPKLDAQVLATALAVYVTNENLAGTTAAAYGFEVTEDGVGVATFGLADTVRDALGLPPNPESPFTVLNLLLATDRLSHNGVLFDMNADGHIGLVEMLVRAIANEVYSAINERGQI